MIEEYLKDITLDYLKKTELGEKLQKAMAGIEKAQRAVMAYVHDDSSDHLKMIKIGTTLVFAILNEIENGKGIKDLQKEDWLNIANRVADYAILEDGQQYSARVFLVYAKYVEASVKVLELANISKDKCDAIRAIAEEVRKLTDQLSEEELTEVAYTVKCLWLLLEAMIKLLSAYSIVIVGEEKAEFAESVAMFVFEYGRYSLYKQEQDILSQYLAHQDEVDIELGDKLEKYRNELRERCKMFEDLISNAFDPDISKRLKATVEIARNAGVSDEDILDSVEKVDEFFL